MQQLFLCSESANSRLKNTILVTHIAFHLAPLTLLTKKMLSTSERKWSQRSLSKTILFSCNFQIQPLQFREKNLFDVSFCVSDHTVSLMVLQNEICLLCNSLLCQERYGKEWLEQLSATSTRKNSIDCIGKRHYM